MLIDTHCHINFNAYDEDREAIIQRACDVGVTRIIIPATDLQTSQEAIDLAGKYTGIYATAGIHPNSTANFTQADITRIRELAAQHRLVAIGEIGLDYYWDKSPAETQKQAFRAQLDLATELELPVIIHNRDASNDVMDILEDWVIGLPDALKDRPGVMHSFSAPPQIAERALNCGFYLGFTGPITFKNADELRHIAATVPFERILVETDGPFLTPTPHRGKRNEPAYIPYIVDRLASIQRITPAEMGRITTQNAERLFKV